MTYLNKNGYETHTPVKILALAEVLHDNNLCPVVMPPLPLLI